MPTPTLWENLAGFVATPLAIWLITLGLGLLVERGARVRLPNPLLIPLGYCVAVAVCLAVYSAHLGNVVALPVLGLLVLLGFWLARRELPGRLNGGWPLLAGVAAFVLFDLSVIATGHWTFTGYLLQDDTAFEMLLARHMQHYGTSISGLPVSTSSSYLVSFLQVGYPLGAQAYLAALGGFLRADLASIWQAYLSSLAAVGAIAASTIATRALGRRLGALAGLLSIAAALTYQYAMQGSIKEVGTVVSVLCALALISYAVLELRGAGAAVIVAVPLAGILATYNAAGLPYVAGLAGSALLASVLVHRRLPNLSWLRPTVLGGAVFGVVALPALLTMATFLRVAKALYTGPQAQALQLGQLLRPLPLSEVAGVWLQGDYRVQVSPGTTGKLEVAATILMLCLMAGGFIYALIRREPAVPMGVVVMGLVLLIVYPRAIPYAQAKLLAIASPIVVLGAAEGLAALRRIRLAPVAALAGVGLGASVLFSDALAYHHDPVAPTRQLMALRDAGHRLGSVGPVLVSEFQEFAKFIALPARVNVGTEYPSPVNLVLRTPGGLYDQSFDLDAEQLSFVESFPYLLVRNSPAASRPPANFSLLYENAFYSTWRRNATPRVLEHLPLQQQYAATATVGCGQLQSLVSHAPAGAWLVAAFAPVSVGYALTEAKVRSGGWIPNPNPYMPNTITPTTPGSAGKIVTVPHAGEYQVWVQGSFPRRVRVTLDGRTVGTAGELSPPDTWLPLGRVRVGAGRHALDLFRGGGDLRPGDGGTGTPDGHGTIGYVALRPQGEERLVSLPTARWRSLCGRPADWVELVTAPARQ